MSDPITLPVLTQSKEPAGNVDLPAEVFGEPVRRHLLYEVVKMQRANRRAGTSSTKTRGAVSGGGKKPWKQKGTGRARAGSSRSPLWVGGATVFGPQPRDYSYRLPNTARKVALRSALSLKAKKNRLIVLDRIELDPPKTKTMAALLSNLGISSALIVVSGVNDGLERATRNLPYAKVLRVEGANVYDILRFDHLIVTRDAIAGLQGRVAL